MERRSFSCFGQVATRQTVYFKRTKKARVSRSQTVICPYLRWPGRSRNKAVDIEHWAVDIEHCAVEIEQLT